MTDQYYGQVTFGPNDEAVNVVFASALSGVYIESYLCTSTCAGSTQYDYSGEAAGLTPSFVLGATTSTATFTHPLGLGADVTSAVDSAVCLSVGGLCATNFAIGMITDYTYSGDLAGETTWSNDATIDGWFGLGLPTVNSENFMYAANQAGDADYMQVFMVFNDETDVKFELNDSA